MLPFDLSPPTGCSASPGWDGQKFVIRDKSTPVLESSENFAGLPK